MYKKYLEIVVSNPHEKPSETEIIRIENKIECKLPASFLEFLNNINGGDIHSYEIEVSSLGETVVITPEVIFTTKMGLVPTFGNFEFMIDFFKDSYIQMPKKMLPFMSGRDESYFFLDLRNDRYSPVCLLKSGRPAWTGRKTQDQLIEISDSFEQFISLWRLNLSDFEQDLIYSIKNSETDIRKDIVQFLDLALPNWTLKIQKNGNI